MSRNLFNSVRRPPVRYNKFNLSFPNYFTADYGVLYPCLVKEVNAGEVFRDYSESMVRTMPLRAPAFIRTDATVHYFFVPFRLCYEDWSKFIVRGDDGNTDYDKPWIDVESFMSENMIGGDPSLFCNGSLMDYLNFPTLPQNGSPAANSTAKLDMMPFNAYSLIYNEYYRDENLIPEVFIWKKSGFSYNYSDWQDHMTEVLNDYYDNPADPGAVSETKINTFPMYLRYRSWRKDYFTSAVPFVQKGVPISLAGAIQGAPGQTGIVGQFVSGVPITQTNGQFLYFARPYGSSGTGNEVQLYGLENTTFYEGDHPENHNHAAYGGSSIRAYGNPVNVITPISGLQSSVMTVSDLRVGLALQQWFELNARVGSDRYFEYLLGHFGVRDRDSRLQRPEYLGGFTHAIQISEVEQNSATDDSRTPQGNLAGKGLGYAANRRVKYRFPEPGYLMAIFSIRPQPVYYQGLPRMYTRWDAFDYYDPLFDHLSEQPIYTSELKYDWSYPAQGDDDSVFGYTPRFSEYRTSLPECHGDFRQDLAYWLSPRLFTQNPELNKDFIEVNGYTQGLYESYAYVGSAQNPSPHFYVHMNHNISILRPMSKYATPKL